MESPSERLKIAPSAKRSAIRVLVLMETYEFGGPARNLLETIKRLSAQVDFRVVTYLRGNAASVAFVEQLERYGIAHSVIRERFRYDLRALRQLYGIVSEYQPHIAQIHNAKSRIYMYLLRATRRLRNLPFIDCYHGETWINRKQIIYNLIDRRLLRLASHVIVVSDKQHELLSGFGVDRAKITVIHNSIARSPGPIRGEDDPTTILTVGRLSREKGHMQFLQAVKRLHASRQFSFNVVMVGDGPELEGLRDYVVRTGLDQVVQFVGYQADTAPYYAQASLFVLPSLSEGMPNVLLEAGMNRLPIVATKVGGVAEVFEHEKEAILVAPTEGELAEAMARCLADRPLRGRLAASAHRRVLEDFTVEKRASQFLEYYTDLVGDPS